MAPRTPQDFCEMDLRSDAVRLPAPGICLSITNLGMVCSLMCLAAWVSETERCRSRLDQLVHGAGALDRNAFHEVFLRVAARLRARRARPHGAAARHEVVEQL